MTFLRDFVQFMKTIDHEVTFEEHPNFPAMVASAIICQVSSIIDLRLNIIHLPTVILLCTAMSVINIFNIDGYCVWVTYVTGFWKPTIYIHRGHKIVHTA